MPSKDIKFDVQKFLADIGDGRTTMLRVRKKQIIYALGTKCDALFYIQATIAILSPAEFVGQEHPL